MAIRKPAPKKPTASAPPAATLVLLVRHGQTPTTGKLLPGRAPGLHLADTGRQQADAVAERIAALKKIDAVYASPLERARETAAPIARATGHR
ncbi:MAG: histidine phosphatase family protein, partial [Ilumatobacteraceae bacterium]